MANKKEEQAIRRMWELFNAKVMHNEATLEQRSYARLAFVMGIYACTKEIEDCTGVEAFKEAAKEAARKYSSARRIDVYIREKNK